MHILDELGIEFDKDIFTSSEIQRILKFFHDINILDILLMSRNEITSFVQLPLFKTKILYSELVKFRNGPLIQTFSDLIKLSDYKYWYLPIGVESIASLFNNFTSIAEIRSSMLIELFGEGSTGKSSLSLYLSNCMIEQGKKVVYVISENFFNPNFMRGLIKEPNNLYISELDFIDDLEILINELFANKDKLNIGMIVIDSLISLLQRQFFVTNQDLSNLVRRQQKLKQILDKLKLLARLMNIIIIYTNHTRSGFEDEDETVALGGLTLGYAPHVRVQLEHVESKPMVQLKNTSTIPTTRCISIVDSSEFPSITKIFDLDDLQLNR